MWQSEEVCGGCKYASYDKDSKEFWCLCENGPEYLEEHRWSDTCDTWEAKDEPEY